MKDNLAADALKLGLASDSATGGVLKQLNQKIFGPEVSAFRETLDRLNAATKTAFSFNNLATSSFMLDAERNLRLGSALSSMKLGTGLDPILGRTVSSALLNGGVSFHLNSSATAAFAKEAAKLSKLSTGFEGLKIGASLQALSSFKGVFDGTELGSTMKRLRELSVFAQHPELSALGATLARIQRISFGIDPSILARARERMESLPPGDEHKALEEDFERLAAAPEELTAKRDVEELNIQVSEINAELIAWLEKHPDKMRELPSRKFEELVAELFRDQGYEVQLTPQTRDGGVDMFITIPQRFGSLLGIVECKCHAAENKIGVAIVERFIHTIREKVKANIGIIATTTTFSQPAIKEAAIYKHQLRLCDFGKLKEMVSQYGKWLQSESAGLWLPNH